MMASRSKLVESMSSSDNIQDLLSCSVCMERFDDEHHQPKLLLCHHTFCKECLVQLAASQSNLTCPSCRLNITLAVQSPEGVAALQTNFYITQMKELLGDSVNKNKGCRKHSGEPLTLFCRSCEVALCPACCETDHRSSGGHVTMELAKAIEEESQLLQFEINEAQQKISWSSSKSKCLESEVGNLQTVRDVSLKDVDEAFDFYVETLNSRREKLKEQVKDMYKQRRDVVDEKLENIKKQTSSLTSLIEQCSDAMSSGSIADVLAYKAKMSSKKQEMSIDKIDCNVGDNFIRYKKANKIKSFLQHCQKLGSVVNSGELPSVVKFKEENAVAGLFTNVVMGITGCSGVALENYPISVDITDLHDDIIPCLVQYGNAGEYQVKFRPAVSGLHRVKVKFLEHHLPGSEFSFSVQSNNPVKKVGQKGSGATELEYPRTVAVDNHNNIYVADTGNYRIQKFDKTGRFLYHFPVSDDVVYSTCGIAIDNDHRTVMCPQVYMRDADMGEANTILCYTLEGELVQRHVHRDVFKTAHSVAVNSLGHIVVADSEINSVFVLDRQGRILRQFGDSGTCDGQFDRPTCVSIGHNDVIVVSDRDNNRIQIFDKSGKFMYKFGKKGSGKGELLLPFGIACDKHRNILVVDAGNKRVQIFKDNGEFVACIESLGDRLRAPRGVAVTSDGHVLVADRDNHCIKKYKYMHLAAT